MCAKKDISYFQFQVLEVKIEKLVSNMKVKESSAEKEDG